MEEKRNVPKLRFPGFTDSWEQRRLGEIGSVAMCKRVYKDQTTEAGDVPFFKIGTFGGEPDAFISNELFEKYRELYSFPKVGDILISAAGTIGRTIVYQGERAYYQDSNIVWLNHDERLDNSFFLQYLNNQTWSSLEGSTLKRLYNKDILDANIALPKPDEQHRIGALFRKLDSLIALHQRELDHVKELKKGLLQKMFPKEGTNVPELRFPGFTDPWEQRRLGDEFDRINERNDGSFGREHWISVSRMFFQDPEAVQSNNIDTRTYVMREGDIAFEGHPNADFQFGRFVANDIGDGVVSELFPVYRHKVNYDNSYWKYAIQLERIMAPIFAKAITSSGNSSNKLDSTHFLKQQILVPRVVEQQAIGALFQKLDSLIALHQRELDHVKELKKGLLQQMFV